MIETIETWQHQYLHGYGNQGLYPYADEGAYVENGDYWRVTQHPNGHYYAWVIWNVPPGTIITRLILRCTVGATNGNDRSGFLLNGNDYTYAYPAALGSNTYDTGEVYLTGLTSVAFGITNLTTASPGSLDSIEIYGVGPNPFLKHDDQECPYNHTGQDPDKSGSPISLYKGEKRERVADLSVVTPAGPLAFTRTYRQSKQGTYAFMGLGWTHNHHIVLTKTPGTPNTIVVQLGSGAEVHFTETYDGSNVYAGDLGSTSDITWDGTKYTLIASDKSQTVFDTSVTGAQISTNVVQITSLVFPRGETLTYTYDGTSKNLTGVSDTYGKSLAFSYISHATYFDDGKLGQVDAKNGMDVLQTVKYAYIQEMLSGSVNGSGALLSTVQDVRGNVWTYTYYGQNAGESDSNQKDFLTGLIAPAVDTNGDGLTDKTLLVKKVYYQMDGMTISGITELVGDSLLKTEFVFQPGGQNITQETTAGRTTTHRFAGNLYLGPQDPAGNASAQLRDPQSLRPATQLDANGHATNLSWSSDGKFLNSVTDALGNPTQFAYNTDTVTINGVSTTRDALDYSLDAQGRKTQYTYGDIDNPRLPTRVQVYDTDSLTVLRWQEFTYDSAGRTTSERTYDPASQGRTLLQEMTCSYYTSGNGNGLLKTVVQKDLQNPANDMTTTYFYDSAGRTIRTKQNLTFGNCTSSFTLYDAEGNVLAGVCNYDPGANADPGTLTQLLKLYNRRTPEVNRITVYGYDALNRRVSVTTDAGASFARTNLTVYDALNRVVRTITNYVPAVRVPDPYTHKREDFDHGPNNDQNLVTDTAYNERGFARRQTDVLGNVTLYGYDDAGRLVKTIQSASLPKYDNSYGLGGDPDLSRYPASSAPDQDLIHLTVYDPAGNVVKTVDPLGNVHFTVYDALNRPVKTVRSASRPNYNILADLSLSKYVFSADADKDLVETTEYDSLGRVVRSQDASGTWTLFGYDALGRQVKTIRSASQPTYNLKADPALAKYPASDAADQDLVTQTAYDSQGRVMYTSDVLGRKTWTGYDGLGRAVQTVANAVGTATDGMVKDPRTSAYNPVINFSDQDLISRTAYDSSGYLLWTQDPLGRKTWIAYDSVGRQVKTITNAAGTAQDGGTGDPRSARYAVSSSPDQDVIMRTEYDALGRVCATLDALGNRTQYTYDTLGRRIQTVLNFMTGKYNANRPDQDLLSKTQYDVAGRVLSTVDTRGTQTTFTYDRVGRRLTVTQAAGTALATTSYVCYDKGGRVLRSIQNWIDNGTSPDAKDDAGNWLFGPVSHGTNNDQNLISTFNYDALGRQISSSDPLGHGTSTTYAKDGQVVSVTDPLGYVTQYRYDRARRRKLVVQAWNDNGEDPALWKWNGSAWTQSDGSTAISFGSDNDRNLIVQPTYDKAGRVLSLRNPKGKLTTYTYDRLDRRTSLTDALGNTWQTAYTLINGLVRTTLTDPLGHVVQRDTDRLGRLKSIQYLTESPKYTPDITFTYDKGGNRLSMSESDGSLVRSAAYTYDMARRLRQVDLDTDGNGAVDQTVKYAYDAGGSRTQLVLPDGKTISYSYDARGRLIALIDWSSQETTFDYDGAGRPNTISRSNALDTTYVFDAASRLTSLSHKHGVNTIAQFDYTLDDRGNRTGVVETQAQYPSGTDTHNIEYNYDALARLLQAKQRSGGTLGSGSVQRQYDYQYDVAGNRTQQVVTVGGTPTTTNYSYNDANQLTSDGTHSFTYNDAGQMTSDGVNTYAWDRAGRLLSVGSTSYLYDGNGNRVQQTVGATVTKYLQDTQPGLAQVLTATTGANVTRQVHSPFGLHTVQEPTGDWRWMVPDALTTVRGTVDSGAAVLESRLYDPYGSVISTTGTSQTDFGFTGEPTDSGDGLVYLRARYYNPTIGQFFGLDPLEGNMGNPLSLNRYAYVVDDPVNRRDPSGLIAEDLTQWSGCNIIEDGCSLEGDTTGCAADVSSIDVSNNYWAPIAVYLNYVAENKQVYLDAAAARVNELKTMAQNNPNKFKPCTLRELTAMSANEFAARMVATDAAINAGGWHLQLWYGPLLGGWTRPNSYTLPFTIVQPILMSFDPVYWGDRQSAGFLELRYTQLLELAQGQTFTSTNIEPIKIPLIFSDNSSNSLMACQDNPQTCFEMYVQASRPDLEAKVSASRYLSFMLQYADPNKVGNPNINPMGIRNAMGWGIVSAFGGYVDMGQIGPTGGYKEAGFDQILKYTRALLGSQDRTCSSAVNKPLVK